MSWMSRWKQLDDEPELLASEQKLMAEVAVALWCDNCGALVKRSRYKDHRFSHGIVDLPDPPPA